MCTALVHDRSRSLKFITALSEPEFFSNEYETLKILTVGTVYNFFWLQIHSTTNRITSDNLTSIVYSMDLLATILIRIAMIYSHVKKYTKFQKKKIQPWVLISGIIESNLKQGLEILISHGKIGEKTSNFDHIACVDRGRSIFILKKWSNNQNICEKWIFFYRKTQV